VQGVWDHLELGRSVFVRGIEVEGKKAEGGARRGKETGSVSLDRGERKLGNLHVQRTKGRKNHNVHILAGETKTHRASKGFLAPVGKPAWEKKKIAARDRAQMTWGSQTASLEVAEGQAPGKDEKEEQKEAWQLN